jgi:hypothetical protein
MLGYNDGARAYEAAYLGRPVITPDSGRAFPRGAVFVRNDAASIASGFGMESQHARYPAEPVELIRDKFAQWAEV